MAWFGKKENTEEVKAEVKAPAQKTQRAITATNDNGSVAHVLKNPRITEKASMHQSMSIYTFDVAANATKSQVAAAVRNVYKVSPRKIRIVSIPAKQTRSMRTGRRGMRSGGKKAYVYLTSGETITIA